MPHGIVKIWRNAGVFEINLYIIAAVIAVCGFEPIFGSLSRSLVEFSDDKCETALDIPFYNVHRKRKDDTKLENLTRTLKGHQTQESK